MEKRKIFTNFGYVEKGCVNDVFIFIEFRYLCECFTLAIQGDSRKARGVICLSAGYIRVLRNDKLSVHFDKLADKKFAYIKKKQYLCSVIKKEI